MLILWLCTVVICMKSKIYFISLHLRSSEIPVALLFHHERSVSVSEIKNWTPGHYIANEASCQEILENPDILREIPLLNNVRLRDVADKQLVRFRGMVQDMYNPEYYFKRYKVKNSSTGETDVRHGMYTDAAVCSVRYLSHFIMYLITFTYVILLYHIILYYIILYYVHDSAIFYYCIVFASNMMSMDIIQSLD
jgi:hypothetical protein